jgi:hypothetical protein
MDFDFSEINYLAVLVCVVMNMVAGALWYSPILFAKPWMQATGFTQESITANKSQANKGYAVSILASALIAIGLALLVQVSGADSVVEGLSLGLVSGLGFVMTTYAATYTFEARPLKLYLINAMYPVVTFACMGMLLAAWD